MRQLTRAEVQAITQPAGAPDSPEDECFCGDYRNEHENGTGACKYRTHHIPDPELNVCRQFRLFGRAGWRERIRKAREQ